MPKQINEVVNAEKRVTLTEDAFNETALGYGLFDTDYAPM